MASRSAGNPGWSSSIKTTTNHLAAIFLLVPIPIGMTNSLLSFSSLIGVFILLATNQFTGRGILHVLLFCFVGCLGLLTSTLDGLEFSEKQFLRASIFFLILILFLGDRISDRFLEVFESFITPFLILALLSVVAYVVFGLGLYNSTLRIPYTGLLSARVFVFPTYLFLLLLYVFSRIQDRRQYLVVLILVATGSKALIAGILLIYGVQFLSRATLRQLVPVLIAAVAIVIFLFWGGGLERIQMFLQLGDPWRVLENLAAIEAVFSSPSTFLFGKGPGIAYWGGHATWIVGDIQGQGAIINSAYDVHNGLLAIALRFGTPLLIWFVILQYQALPKRQAAWGIFLALFLVQATSHGSVQTVEALGLALGLQYAKYKL